ncbi:MAG TPA: hypothetical protein VFH47_01020 [Candidatus Thermoplasmatota archaeon]|nr:hypothetical protein [Candidatus Thermoplasmatota archaeon]
MPRNAATTLVACLLLLAAGPSLGATLGGALAASVPSAAAVLPGGQLEVVVRGLDLGGGPPQEHGCIVVTTDPPSTDPVDGQEARPVLCPRGSSHEDHTLQLPRAGVVAIVETHGDAGRAPVLVPWGRVGRLVIEFGGNATEPHMRILGAGAPLQGAGDVKLVLVALQATAVTLSLILAVLPGRLRWPSLAIVAGWALGPATGHTSQVPMPHLPVWLLVAATALLAWVAWPRKAPTEQLAAP